MNLSKLNFRFAGCGTGAPPAAGSQNSCTTSLRNEESDLDDGLARACRGMARAGFNSSRSAETLAASELPILQVSETVAGVS